MNTKDRIIHIQICIGCFFLARFIIHILEAIQIICFVTFSSLLLYEINLRTRIYLQSRSSYQSVCHAAAEGIEGNKGSLFHQQNLKQNGSLALLRFTQ